MNKESFNFITSCNNEVSNLSEFNIYKTIITNIKDINNISLDQISNESNISIASVSRLIKKNKFSSFISFKQALSKLINGIKFYRSITHVQRFSNKQDQEIIDILCQDALNNLQSTYKSIDKAIINQIIYQIKKASQVIIIGDYHELAIFYTLQLDLLANEIPCFLFTNKEYQEHIIHNLKKDSLIIFLSVYKEFNPDIIELNKKVIQQNIKTIAISQEKYLDSSIQLTYGLKNSLNDGYYSLELIVRTISELLYHYKI